MSDDLLWPAAQSPNDVAADRVAVERPAKAFPVTREIDQR